MAGYVLGNELQVQTHDGATYRGFLGQVDPVTQTISLVRTRSGGRQDVLVFRGQDIKRLSEATRCEGGEDPAILMRGPVVGTLPPRRGN